MACTLDMRERGITPKEIRKAREGAGLTQEALARELGVSLSAVCRWEQGVRSPTGLCLRAVERWLRKQAKR